MSISLADRRTEPTAAIAAFLGRVTAWICTVGGLGGLLAAAVLTVEKLNLAADPTYVPTCSINPILSCGSVMSSPQAQAFGVPNTLIGIAGFAVVSTIGVALLARVQLPRWFWLGLQAGATFGVLFVHWLIYQSLYVIGALCPYCMLVWAVTIPIFLYVTMHNLYTNARAIPRVLRPSAAAAVRYHSLVLVSWYAAIVVAVLQRFWDYWTTLI
ncbi:vitamin K epoxide reductase family protein [Micromonospora aurantiaca (nom. illeg.)]|uniref:vitamin K epoxide reductase family protein n=1 Tax=Micromonospora aurantiaca (nom. illeg.) TaxID=47850 RepID=UPI0016571266|nr:vitamin K epoxide reductase family protein [Micromonospora aurantiaca]MBC9003664.1 vitamin K epoxide reductase family protein [Micromonospora aurantiaca]